MIRIHGYSDDNVYVYDGPAGEHCAGVDDDCAQMTERSIFVGTGDGGIVVRIRGRDCLT